MQERQVRRIIGDEKERESLAAHLGARVEGLWTRIDPGADLSRNNLDLRGRVVAVSEDGYFLTAYHAVDEGAVYLHDFTKTEAFEEALERASATGGALSWGADENDKYFKAEIHRGRVVWFDRESDLAVVKFERVAKKWFSNFAEGVASGQAVVCADDEGVGRLSSGQSIGDMRGNWRYLAAGRVVATREIGTGLRENVTDIIARKGMSGGAVTNLDGELCGVLVSIAGTRWGKRYSWVNMVSKEQLKSVIRRDRRSNGASKGRED